MKKILIIVSICVASVILVVSLFVYFLFAFLKKEQNKEFYVLGNDSIASFTSVVGERRLTGISIKNTNGEESKSYSYRSDEGMEEGKKYAQYLHDSEEFERIEAEQGVVCYRKQSKDTSMVLTITIVVSNKGVYITIYKQNELSFVSALSGTRLTYNLWTGARSAMSSKLLPERENMAA